MNTGRSIGCEVRLFDELPSTNDTAMAHAANPGLVVAARHQTAGRGQHGRIWQADADSSLLASIVVPPLPEFRRPAIITAWMAVGIAEAIQALTGAAAAMKWPNDLLVDGRKACGILIESGRATVAGFGLNLNQTHEDFREANLPAATSLRILAGRTFDVRDTLETVLDQLDAGFRTVRDGRIDLLEAAWIDRIGLLGRAVRLERNDGSTVSGRLADLTFNDLILEPADGDPLIVPPEAVRHLFPL
jgi:BirA family biotin operon repressor/biotin-[acetyl-CoA-carboxylase] ligase